MKHILIFIVFLIFSNFLSQGSVVGDLLDDVIPIFVTNFDPDKDPEMRLKFFSLLSRLVMTSSSTLDSCHKFGDFAVSVVKDIIIPNCLWKAGRVAGAIRTTATSCMWALLQSGMLNKEKVCVTSLRRKKYTCMCRNKYSMCSPDDPLKCHKMNML